MAALPSHHKRIEVEDVGDVSVVGFVNKRILDEEQITDLGAELFRLVDELGRRNVLLDFGNVEFLSSAALGKLVTLQRKLQTVSGKLVLYRLARDILELFQIIRLDRYLSIAADPDLVGPDDAIHRMFGNPFRSAAFSPDWRTSTVLTLAKQMRESDEFSATPILADALQDAGCDSEDLLAHLRNTAQSHIRYRWVLDLVMGRV